MGICRDSSTLEERHTQLWVHNRTSPGAILGLCVFIMHNVHCMVVLGKFNPENLPPRGHPPVYQT